MPTPRYKTITEEKYNRIIEANQMLTDHIEILEGTIMSAIKICNDPGVLDVLVPALHIDNTQRGGENDRLEKVCD